MDDVQTLIKEQITQHPVVLYMKGSPMMPLCGFSATAVQILRACNLPLFFRGDVLGDPALRDGIKIFCDRPTIPQL